MPRSPEIFHEEDDLNESFQEYFSEGTLTEIGPSEYDDHIVDALRSFQDEVDYVWQHVYRIDHDNGDSTYAACSERETKIKTTEDVRGQGIGIRRLREMNALAQVIYKKPLHSGEPIEPESEKLWKNLVHNQEADKEIIDGIT